MRENNLSKKHHGYRKGFSILEYITNRRFKNYLKNGHYSLKNITFLRIVSCFYVV